MQQSLDHQCLYGNLYTKISQPIIRMIKNYILNAWRFFLRQRFYSALNLIGLSTGLVCTLLIFLWVRDEWQMDRFHHDIEKIFQVKANYSIQPGEITTWNGSVGPLAEYLRESVPEVQFAARIDNSASQLIQHDDRGFVQNGFYADADFFDIFNYPILKGSLPKDRLDKTALMISQDLAIKLFGSEEPIGKQVRMSGRYDMHVVAVFENVSTKSSLKFEFLAPIQIVKERLGDAFNWGNYQYLLFVKLKDVKQVEALTNKIYAKTEEMAKAMNDDNNVKPYLQPYADTYLHAAFKNGQPEGGRIQYVIIFIVVAIFILLIACINFTNMATAKAINRSKEIGVRKVVGAERYSIMLQFLGESLLMSFMAMAFAVLASWIVLPVFNLIVEKQIQLQWFDPVLWIAILGVVLLTGLLAGGYPALFLSSFQPTSVLKGVMTTSFKGASLRKVLVTFQFAITVVLIVGSVIILQQVNYIRNKNLGYDRQAVLRFRAPLNFRDQYEAFRQELKQKEGIVNVSRANSSLSSVANQSTSIEWAGKPEDDSQMFRVVIVDYDFIETFKIEIVNGRSFSPSHNDSSNVILTEKAAERIGFSDPLGQPLTVWQIKGKIVGIARNVNVSSIQNEVDPVIFICITNYNGHVFIRFDPEKTKIAIDGITSAFKKFNPDHPFDYTFVDDEFEDLYKSEKVTASLAIGFTVMAMIISMLGLLGLVSYTVERKRKEISIRKTLGASVRGLILATTNEFIKICIVASIVGSIVAYYFVDQFLASYAYHVELDWRVFVATILFIALFATVTAIYQISKAALANPAEVLRRE
jgi:putative ABC transport system permease protein